MRLGSSICVLACLLPGFASLPVAAAAEHPKVIVLGFDGADGRLAEQFMGEGILPHLSELRSQGTFHKLLTSNPGESPVAWSCINTGCNPGKTNIFGFVRRYLHSPFFKPQFDANGQLVNKAEYAAVRGIFPGFGHMEDATAPASVMLPFDPSKRALYIGGAAVLCFLLVLLLLKAAFKANIAVAGLIGLALAGGAAYGLYRLTAGVPLTVPSTADPQKATPFWDYLDAAGVRSVCLQAAVTAPAKAGDHTRLLSGLGVRDVGMGPGSWYVYTSRDYEYPHGTETGGWVFRIKMKPGTSANVETLETTVRGPENFVEVQAREREIDELAKVVAAGTAADLEKLKRELQTKRFEFSDWRAKRRWATAPMTGVADYDQKTLKLTIGSETQTLKEGGWSEFYHPEFVLSSWIKAHGATRVQLVRCEKEEVRLYMTVIGWDPEKPWPQIGLSSPLSFTADLAKQIGTFDTIGWACETMALKDEEIEDQSFLDDISHTVTWRRNMLMKALSMPDWNCLFQVIGEPDRVAHMMYRYFDEQHPLYKAAEADQPITMLGRTFKKRDAIRQIYMEIDTTVGLVMDRIKKGEFGKDVVLILCSDHGFTSFREEVELNRFLVERKFLVPKSGAADMTDINEADWSKTKAYSLGLGSIFINLKGREPNGSVEPQDYDKVCDEIIRALDEWRNDRKESKNDPKIVKAAHKRSQVYSGDWWKEEIGADGYVRKQGAADIVVGFERGYRIAWGTAGGGVGAKALSDNQKNWSGDHVSVDPDLVRGIFFCNRKLSREVDLSVYDIAPTVLSLFGVAVPATMDGKPAPLN